MKLMDKVDDGTTVGSVKKFLRDNYTEGARCPCCGQVVKLYKRSITSSMAYGLILMANAKDERGGDPFLHVEDFFKSKNIPSSIRGDIPKLTMFGLLMSPIDGKGIYGVTPLGFDFVNGVYKAPAYVEVYNNKVIRTSDKMVTIQQALKNKFEYQKLMKGELNYA